MEGSALHDFILRGPRSHIVWFLQHELIRRMPVKGANCKSLHSGQEAKFWIIIRPLMRSASEEFLLSYATGISYAFGGFSVELLSTASGVLQMAGTGTSTVMSYSSWGQGDHTSTTSKKKLRELTPTKTKKASNVPNWIEDGASAFVHHTTAPNWTKRDEISPPSAAKNLWNKLKLKVTSFLHLPIEVRITCAVGTYKSGKPNILVGDTDPDIPFTAWDLADIVAHVGT